MEAVAEVDYLVYLLTQEFDGIKRGQQKVVKKTQHTDVADNKQLNDGINGQRMQKMIKFHMILKGNFLSCLLDGREID